VEISQLNWFCVETPLELLIAFIPPENAETVSDCDNLNVDSQSQCCVNDALTSPSKSVMERSQQSRIALENRKKILL
jgi:hypothetical protein